MKLRQWTLVSLGGIAGACCVSACGQGADVSAERTASVSEAVNGTTPPGIPCQARADAVIANSGPPNGMVFSDARSLVDSYQSSLGPYGGANVGANGNVQAGSTIIHNGGVIHGTQTPNTPGGLAVVPVPAGTTVLRAGSPTPGVVLLNGGQNLTLAPGSYQASSFTMNPGSTLTISPAGQVLIWVTGALILGGTENLNGVPANLQFLVTSNADVNINSGTGSDLFGFVYAPNARVNVDSTVFGGVTGETVTLNSGSAVHFDANSVCTPPLPPQSCATGSSLTVLIQGSNVTAYVPNGSWSEVTSADTGVIVAPIEPAGSGTPSVIPTPGVVNTCGANSSTGEVVCTSNVTDIYLINGTTLTTTLTSGADTTALETFSGGECVTCNVAVDEVNNEAFVSIATTSGAAFQPLNLATGTLGTPFPVGMQATSEDVLADPIRGFVLSPEEQGDYQLVNEKSGATFNFPVTGSPVLDSAAEDCTTGIALASDEGTGNVFLADLTQATFSGTTWTAPNVLQNVPEFASGFVSGTVTGLDDGTNGIAIAPGSHLGVVAGEFGGAGFGAIQLPATSGSGTPALVDWVLADLGPTPDNNAWVMGRDPHTLTAYTSPTSNKQFAVFVDDIDQDGTKTFLAVVDMQALLAAPRSTADAHVIAANPLPASIVRYIAIP